MQDSQIDVLIIGAGPAGLMAATALTKAGVNVRIVDKRTNRVTVGHADGLQARTVEVLHSYGLVDRIRNNGVQIVMQSFYASSPDSNGIFLTQRAPATLGPLGRFHGITTHQGTIEENFINYLTSAGVEMETLTTPSTLNISDDSTTLADPHSYPVSVTLSTPSGGEEVVRAKYVIGADGARSWVRETLRIPMVGENTEYVWGVLDILPDTDFPDFRHISVMQSQTGSVLIIPRERGLIRLYVQLENQADLFDSNGAVIREKVTADTILDVAKRSMKPYKIAAIGQPEWWSVYRIRQQVASRFHEKERVFIVGDACHTHSPKAGQGMNASINDSHNLAWKLTHVLRGWAKPSLLATYEAERRSYALQLIAFDKIFSSSVSKRVKANAEDKGEGITREELMKVVNTFGSFQSGIGIRYESGPLINVTHQSLASKLTIGERLPPATIVNAADGIEHNLQDLVPSNFRYKVLLFAGDVSVEAQRERLHAAATVVEKRFSQSKEGTSKADVHVIGYGEDITEMSVHLQKLPGLDWYRSFADTTNAFLPAEGKLHEAFGIDAQGAAIVVRPDGYVAAVGRLDASLEQDLSTYFDVYAT